LRSEVNLIEAYTASLKGAIEVSGQDVNVLGMITAQQFNVTYVSSSVMYRSGSTEFGDTSDDRHLFTGSLIVSGTLAAGTDETGWGRISFNESSNTLRIQSSKNGTNCIPISFWSQQTGGTFAESMTISGSRVGIGRTPEFTFDVNGDIALNRTNKLQFTGGVVGDRARSYLTGDGNNNIFVYGPSNNLIATFGYTGDTTFSGPVSGTRFTPTYVTSTSGYENVTNTVSTAGGVYYFVKDSGAGEGSSATTFNITGVPDTDGAGFDLTLVVKKSATVANINTSAIVQINGNTIGEIATVFASGTAAVTTVKTARMVRVGGNWRPMGSVGTY
jgi:hypothetical protein